MNLSELIIKYPDILKITPTIMIQSWCEKMGLETLDFKSTYGEQGVDNLDLIEWVMNLENELDISIDDSVIDILFSTNSYPINLTEWVRNDKLEKLGVC
jgi:acyl carrier protein